MGGVCSSSLAGRESRPSWRTQRSLAEAPSKERPSPTQSSLPLEIKEAGAQQLDSTKRGPSFIQTADIRKCSPLSLGWMLNHLEAGEKRGKR